LDDVRDAVRRDDIRNEKERNVLAMAVLEEQFVVEAKGKKTRIILSLKRYQ
jgi:hypothetical protein